MAGTAVHPLDPDLAIDWPIRIDPSDRSAAVGKGRRPAELCRALPRPRLGGLPAAANRATRPGWWNSDMAWNVIGTELESCGTEPLTGFYRDGCCNTGADDLGVHTVCARVTAEFLEFSKAAGNDLSTPQPAYGFAGLQAR